MSLFMMGFNAALSIVGIANVVHYGNEASVLGLVCSATAFIIWWSIYASDAKRRSQP